MPDLEGLARAQRRALLLIDHRLASQLVDAYTLAWRRLAGQMSGLTASIEAAGADASPGWLFRQERLRSIEGQIVGEVAQIARSGNGAISAAQWEAVALAQAHAREAVALALGPAPEGVSLSFNLLPADAVHALVGSLGDGRPLTALLDTLGPEAARTVRDALTDGVILGEGPATIARRARAAFGGNAARAIQISRDAVIRSYKTGSLSAYRQNADVVRGWVWIASLGPRSCLACISKHGSEHPLTEEFHDHSRGRCCAAPLTRSWKEIIGRDVPDAEQPPIRSGGEWFAEQPADVQERIAGRAKAAALRSRAITIDQVAGSTTGAWGKVLHERSLTAIVGKDRAREIIERARRPSPDEVPRLPTPPTRPGVPTFKTATDGAQWMADNRLAARIGLPQGTKPDGLRELAQGVSDANERFGLPPLSFIGAVQQWGFSSRPLGPRTLAAYSQAKHALLVGPRVTDAKRIEDTIVRSDAAVRARSPLEGLRQAASHGVAAGVTDPALIPIVESLERRRWMVGENTRDIIHHEMGHHLEATHPQRDELLSIASQAKRRGWAMVMSEYAKTNTSEYVAESFAAYMKRETARLNPDLLAWFRAHDKGGSP